MKAVNIKWDTDGDMNIFENLPTEVEIPDNILVQVLTTGPNPKIIKQGNKSGFHDAFDIGTIWLERALAEGNN